MPKHRRTPAHADRGAGLHIICRCNIWTLIRNGHPWVSCSNCGEATERGLSWCMSNGPSRDKSGTAEDPPPPNCVLTTMTRCSCRNRGQGNSRKHATRQSCRSTDVLQQTRNCRGPPNCVLTTMTRCSCRNRGQGNNRKHATRQVLRERRTS